MKLSEQERRVLHAVELEANAPMERLRKETKYRDHTIRYHLERLIDRGIARKQAFINVYPLGYSDYSIYFSIAAQSTKVSSALMAHLTASPQVSWIAQLGGDYQYGFSICARNTSEVVQYLDKLSEKFPNAFFDKALSIRVSLTLFSRKYLLPAGAPVRSITFGDTGSRAEIDAKDELLLSTLSNTPLTTFRELARRIAIPHATIERRLDALEKQKVIAGYVYQVDASRYGMSHYRLLIYAKGLNRSFGKTLYQFAERHRSITYFLQTLGDWDFELGAEVENNEQVVTLTQELYNSFSSDLNTVKVLPLFGHAKISNFPFKPAAGGA